MDRGIKQQVRRRKSKAQGLVEFALITPVLLLMIFGIIDFGWMIFNYAQLYNAVREGARYGSVSGFGTTQFSDCAGIKAEVIKRAGFSGIKPSNITIVYDDGIPFNVDSWIAYQNGGATYTPVSMTAYCTSGNVFTTAAWHVGTESPASGARDTGTLNNGDRIVIQVDVDVQFLTPIIKTLWKSGLNMKFWVGRSLFPGGIELE
jgi:Flp pilus assembly protein TadG